MKKVTKPAGLKQKVGGGNFQCPHCPYRSKKDWLLRGHLVGHSAAEPFSCSIKSCSYQTNWKNLFYSHMRNVHSTRYVPPGRKLQSVIKTGKSRKGQQVKLKATPPSPVKPAQSKTKKATQTVRKLQKDPINPNLFLCPFPSCGLKTLYEFSMTRHFKTHEKHGTQSYSCLDCHGQFSNKVWLGRHKRHCSAQLQDNSSLRCSTILPQNVKIYTCEVPDCNFKTRHRPSIHRHRRSHTKHGNFKHNCTACQRKFATIVALRRHGHFCVANQTSGMDSAPTFSQGEKRTGRWYTCTVTDCNFKTRHNSSLWCHQKRHLKNGNLVHKCGDCQGKFPSPAALLRHRNLSLYTTGNCSSLQQHQQRLQHSNYAPMDPNSCGKAERAGNYPDPANNENNEQDSDASELAHNSPGESDASAGCTFCSYMSCLGKYLSKHMTECPGCHKSTKQKPGGLIASSTSVPVQVPSQARSALPHDIPNFGCMLCGYVAQSESHALDHARIHKTPVVALERFSHFPR